MHIPTYCNRNSWFNIYFEYHYRKLRHIMETRSLISFVTFAFSDVNTILVGICVFLLSWFYRNNNQRSKEHPLPGFMNWRMLLLVPNTLMCFIRGMNFHEILIQWGKRYNGLFCFGFPGFRMLVINDFEAIREAFKHPDLNDRPPNVMRDSLFRGKGKRSLKTRNIVIEQRLFWRKTKVNPWKNSEVFSEDWFSVIQFSVFSEDWSRISYQVRNSNFFTASSYAACLQKRKYYNCDLKYINTKGTFPAFEFCLFWSICLFYSRNAFN